jgi:hypothetical protein
MVMLIFWPLIVSRLLPFVVAAAEVGGGTEGTGDASATGTESAGAPGGGMKSYTENPSLSEVIERFDKGSVDT